MNHIPEIATVLLFRFGIPGKDLLDRLNQLEVNALNKKKQLEIAHPQW